MNRADLDLQRVHRWNHTCNRLSHPFEASRPQPNIATKTTMSATRKEPQ